jgi:hypothetical protein
MNDLLGNFIIVRTSVLLSKPTVHLGFMLQPVAPKL